MTQDRIATEGYFDDDDDLLMIETDLLNRKARATNKQKKMTLAFWCLHEKRAIQPVTLFRFV